jgi:hypothetical protein
MEKIAQENAVLSKDLESLIREVAAMTTSKLLIFRRLQPLIFTQILPVNPSTKGIDDNALQYSISTVYSCSKMKERKKNIFRALLTLFTVLLYKQTFYRTVFIQTQKIF